MATNQYQLEARYRKASKLAAHLFAYSIHACDLPKITAAEWLKLASVVGVNAPSADTIAVVDQILRDLELAKSQMEREQGDRAFDMTTI